MRGDGVRYSIEDNEKVAVKSQAYSISEIPVFNIDYRGLVDYARKKGKSVPELSDEEKNLFIDGATIDDIDDIRIIID